MVPTAAPIDIPAFAPVDSPFRISLDPSVGPPNCAELERLIAGVFVGRGGAEIEWEVFVAKAVAEDPIEDEVVGPEVPVENKLVGSEVPVENELVALVVLRAILGSSVRIGSTNVSGSSTDS